MNSDVEYTFINLFVIYISAFEQCLFILIVCFLNWVMFFLLLSSVPYILDALHLPIFAFVTCVFGDMTKIIIAKTNVKNIFCTHFLSVL